MARAPSIILFCVSDDSRLEYLWLLQAMKRRIEFSVETEKITLRGAAPVISWCADCERHSMRITPEQAALLAGVSELLVYRMIEGEQLHRTETAEGRFRICMASLLKVAWDEGCGRQRPA
jgi:hypothetical protein